MPNCTLLSPLCPYEARLLRALLDKPHSRLELDRAVGTTNSAEYVRRFRRRGLNIVMRRVTGLNRDGKPIWWGIYNIDDADKGRVLDALGGATNG